MDPSRLFLQKATAEMLREALEELPAPYREVIILRELEGYSYKEISVIVGVPLGTVMSRLTRGRERLQRVLGAPLGGFGGRRTHQQGERKKAPAGTGSRPATRDPGELVCRLHHSPRNP
jgi:RNA polymerase sigma-70 factor (ECF subfamily)